MLNKMLNKMLTDKNSLELNKDEREFLPLVPGMIEAPPSVAGRLIMWLIIALILLTLVWSIVGKTSEVAVAPGKIIPSGNVKIIQAEDKGVIKRIHVKEGQSVKKDQLLLELDSTISLAELDRIKKEIAYYNLELERLTAEEIGIDFNPVAMPEIDVGNVAFQRKLYQTRLIEYNTKLAALHQRVSQNRANLTIALVNKEKLSSLWKIAKEREEKIDSMVQQDAVAPFVLLDYQAKRIEIEQNLASQISEIERAGSALRESEKEVENLGAERNKEIMTKKVEERKLLQAWLEELKKAEEKDRLSRLISPIDGKVHQLVVHTVGGVVTAAQSLMIIVPDDVTLEVEAWVANKDIGFVHKGQSAEIKVETFNFQKYGTVLGEVADVSPDAIEDKEKGLVYRATLTVDRKSMDINQVDTYLSPGMSVTAEIKTREKRIIEFFLDPFKRYLSEGLRER